MPSMKCVAIGDTGVGKTCLLQKFSNENFEVDDNAPAAATYMNDPKCNEYWVQIHTFDKKKLNLQLCDTSALDCYECSRTAQYASADIILICFSVVDRESFQNIRKRWVPELFINCPYKPTILVGTKTDLIEIKPEAEDLDNNHITYAEGWCMARDIGAFAYIECTALLDLDVSIVFDMALECVMQKKAKQKEKEKSQESRRCPCRCPLM